MTMNKHYAMITLGGLILSQSLIAQTLPTDDELLFYQSCDNTLLADVHRGKGQPNFVAEITQIEDGVRGKAFHCGDSQLLTLHNLGGKTAPATEVVLLDKQGQRIAQTTSTPLAAPQDLTPSTQEVKLTVPAGVNLGDCQVVIDPEGKIDEIYEENNKLCNCH